MLQIDTFRNRLLVLFAGLAFTLGLCITLYIGHIASAQMTKTSGQNLYIAAKSISNTLANSLAEREREMILLSQSLFFAEANFDNSHVQQQLDQVKKSYKYYAWLGIANLEGKVEVAANQLLQGADVSERDWFIHGLNQVYLGDVHKAVLLAKKIKALNPNEPIRFIDFATPIYDPTTHQVKGVLAAHADWSWASHVIDSALSETTVERGIEVFIVNKKGEVLYPFKSIGKVNPNPPDVNASNETFFMHEWGDGQKYLTTDVPVLSDTQTNVGWHVIIRQPRAIALADVRSLQHHILAIGLIISLLMLFVTYRLSNRFSRPIEQLAESAHAVEQGEENIHFEANSSIREIKGLSQSLNSMKNTLLTQKNQLIDANTTLEQKVQERTQALKEANIELEKLARHDALTGLYNRRAFNDCLDYLYAQFNRSHIRYAVLLMDVDFFKKVNDRYGHDVGDLVLKSVAEVLSTTVRESDFVARYGGEEFIVLLPATTLEGAVVLAENLRHAIEQALIMENHPITVSVGVSVVQGRDGDAQAAVRRADHNLYKAKQQGRNQVVTLL